MVDKPHTLGFIGLGAMGKPMVTNLAKKLPSGSIIQVYDIVTAPAEELTTHFPGIVNQCFSASEVASKSDIIITMLPESSHVRTVYFESIIPSFDPALSKLLLDCSTIDLATSLEVAENLKVYSPTSSFYDAPVSGGVLGATAGTIAFFLGISPTDPNLTRLAPLLSLMGSKTIPCGGPSLGLAAKLSNNYLSGIITIATAEAMDMGMRAGIDAEVLAQVFKAGTAQNTICDVFNPVPGVCAKAPASNGYKNGFRVELMRKDMRLALDMARRVGCRNALGAGGLGVYAAASESEECRGLDSRVVYRWLGGREDWKA
ncbi:hypothetical protein OQA88_6002 [Cercophora sp. LCS_1]